MLVTRGLGRPGPGPVAGGLGLWSTTPSTFISVSLAAAGQGLAGLSVHGLSSAGLSVAGAGTAVLDLIAAERPTRGELAGSLEFDPLLLGALAVPQTHAAGDRDLVTLEALEAPGPVLTPGQRASTALDAGDRDVEHLAGQLGPGPLTAPTRKLTTLTGGQG